MWRDEIHSWGLVLASPSLSDLLANLRFTGHPSLWYLILWLASWFTDSPYTVQVVHAAIGILLIGAIGLVSPFSRLEKVLLLCSYFVLYEYTVVSRNYGIGFLIALIYADMRARRPDRVYLNAVLLGLLANTNMFAFLLSGALAIEYALAYLLRWRGAATVPFRAIPVPALIYLALVAFAAAIMWPSPDTSWRSTGEPFAQATDLTRLLVMLAGTATSMIPTHPLSYWDADAEGALLPAMAVALPVLALIYVRIFSNSRQLLIIPGLTALASIAVGQLIYSNSIRHWGFNFIAFVAALWIARVWNAARPALAVGLLAASAIAGIAISIQQFPLTFSNGKAAAEWIESNGLADEALVGTPDTYVAVVAQYLGKPIYFLDCSCTDTFLFYHKRRDLFSKDQIPDRLARAVEELKDRPILFITTHSLSDSELSAFAERGVETTSLAEFEGASTDEDFYVYRVDTPKRSSFLRTSHPWR
jgi:hypothetical protein